MDASVSQSSIHVVFYVVDLLALRQYIINHCIEYDRCKILARSKQIQTPGRS